MYVASPAESIHVNVGSIETPVDPVAGAASVNAVGNWPPPPPPAVLNVAVTAVLEFNVTVHVPVPGQFIPVPDQPANVEPVAATAVRTA